MKFGACTFLGLLLAWARNADGQTISRSPVPGFVKLGSANSPPDILISSNETAGVTRTATDLVHDFGQVLGKNSTLWFDELNGTVSSIIIIAGTLGHSGIIANLSKNGRIKSVADIEGKWESFTQELVHNPLPGVSLALVVVGSDKRGTIYGLYSISEAIGVSPWYWWADVPITPTETLYFDPRGKIQDPPSIKYRGIFINDEEQCLTGWAGSRFALAGGDQRRPFTSEFYKRVFELILRLKANYIWPAMKYSMFYVDDANNGKLADDYGIVVGSSHHEPMARAYVEQTRYVSGPWDWSKNSENITKFMSVGVERSRNWETLYTMGMRGEGDLESPTLTAPQLEEILKVQQESISKTLSVDISTIPQTWVLYKVCRPGYCFQ